MVAAALRYGLVAALAFALSSFYHRHGGCLQSAAAGVTADAAGLRGPLTARVQPLRGLGPQPAKHHLGQPASFAVPLRGAARPRAEVAAELASLPVFVVALDQEEAHDNVRRLAHELAAQGLPDVRWWNATNAKSGLYCGGAVAQGGVTFKTASMGRPLTMGELATRDSFRRVLLHAWAAGIERFIVLEDDAVPHCELRERLLALLQAPPCGAWAMPHLASGGRPGVFMLGATCYALNHQNVQQSLQESAGQCYHATLATYGAFALLFRRDTIPAILRWLEENGHPWDNFFGPMDQKPEFEVQVAYPNLFAPELRHDSATQPWKEFNEATVERRMKEHGWEEAAYCGWPHRYEADPGAAPWARSPPQPLAALSDSAQAQLRAALGTMEPYDGGSAAATLPTVVLTLAPESERVVQLLALLKAHGMRNVRVFQGTDGRRIWGGPGDTSWSAKSLRPGELGVRHSQRDVLAAAWAAGLERLLVLEDDVVPACELRARLEAALAEEACGRLALEAAARDGGRGGVLMLGATEYSKWPGLLEEVAGGDGAPAKGCYTCNQGTYGAFAVVYSRAAIPYVLRFLEEIPLAFDNQWDYLKIKGLTVRVAYPNIFMPDVGHASATNPARDHSNAAVAKRLEQHRWDPALYCRARAGL